ncbi:MAG: hypothetical protein HKP41_08275 [Desulfobacterales bacterium]|nr:hypothetical protein [Deltaproteobacteria bacterium]NNK94331.1 hypothetical protein [Desulfobacterales bacterium]
MSRMIKKAGIVTTVLLMILSGSAWAGWFTFEPNMVLLDGTRVSVILEDIEKDDAYLEKGDMERANQLVNDNKIFVIKTGRDLTRVKFLDYKEKDDGNIYVEVKDESGNKLWSKMSGLARDQDGKKKNITKQDLLKGEFAPLSEAVQ